MLKSKQMRCFKTPVKKAISTLMLRIRRVGVAINATWDLCTDRPPIVGTKGQSGLLNYVLCGTPILRRFQHTFISLRCRLQRCIRMVGAAITVFSAPVKSFSIRMASGQETQTVMVFTRSIQIRLKVPGRRCETSFVPFVAFIKSSSPVTSQSVSSS